jgi:Ser/Thr protein kinase RdoA (MazF antagonist)
VLPGQFVHTTLSAAAAAELAFERFDIPRPEHVRLVKRGLNDVYAVDRLFLRLSRADRRSVAEVQAEACAIAELKQRGATVSVALRGRDGRFCQCLAAPEGDRAVLLFAGAPGVVAEHSPHDARALGVALGRVHAVQTSPFQGPQVRRLDLDLFFERVVPLVLSQLSGQSDASAELQTIAEGLRARLLAYGDSLSVGFCHGDCHGHNATIDRGTATLFDFDEGGVGWLAYDLAVYLSTCRRLAAGGGAYLWSHFFDGYRSEHALRPADIDALETMLVLRRLWGLGISAEGTAIWGDQWFRTSGITYDIRALTEQFARLSAPDLLSRLA